MPLAQDLELKFTDHLFSRITNEPDELFQLFGRPRHQLEMSSRWVELGGVPNWNEQVIAWRLGADRRWRTIGQRQKQAGCLNVFQRG
jgi:hypothetical protein